VDGAGHYPECATAKEESMQYANVVFLQGDEAIEVLELLDAHGVGAAIEYLSEWDYGDYGEVSDAKRAGYSDSTVTSAPYVLTWNERMGYIGLERILD
jgi:hypothetical protein